MTQPRAQALLVCRDHGGMYLSNALAKRGWTCQVTPSHEAGCQLFETTKFDLVLSEVRLHQAKGNPLIRFLTESGSSMFVSQGVEAGCWWLPVIRGGQDCWGAPALRPSELLQVIDELREEVLKGTLENAGTSYFSQPWDRTTVPKSRARWGLVETN